MDYLTNLIFKDSFLIQTFQFELYYYNLNLTFLKALNFIFNYLKMKFYY
jgi:hypothetical protein